MTTSVVQGGMTLGTAGDGTVSRALATNATAGNELVAVVWGNGANTTTLTVSDNNSNTWSYVDATKIVSNGSFLVAIRIAIAENIHAGATTVTGTNTANGTDVPVIVLLEVSGTPTSSSIDGTLHSTNSGTSTSPNTVAFTPTAGDLLVGAMVDLSGLNPETITGNGSWTNTVGGNSLINTNGSTSYCGGVQFIANAPASSSQNSWTIGDSQGWAAAVVALKAAAAAPAAYPFPTSRRYMEWEH